MMLPSLTICTFIALTSAAHWNKTKSLALESPVVIIDNKAMNPIDFIFIIIPFISGC
jgi:hypothetical protein